MKIQVLLFGITTDLVGTSQLEIEVANTTSVKEIKTLLKEKHPTLENIDSYAIAVNETYANDNLILQEKDVVAIIPPVSGG